MPNPGPASSTTPHYLLQADTSDGYLIGTLSTTPIGMYGVTPVAQRSNANQLSVSSAAPAATLLSINTIGLTATAVGVNLTLSTTLSATGSPVATGDFLIVNKPTAQAGLGIGNVRPQGATNGQIIVQYANLTGSTITATASEVYSIADFRGMASSITLSPAGVAGNTSVEQLFNVTGIAVGQIVMLNKATEQVGIVVAGARAVSNNVLGITFMNVSTASITPTASETYSYVATNGIGVNSNIMVYGVNVGTQLGVLNTASTNTWMTIETALTVSTVVANDIFIGASKPSAQAQIAVVGGRITTANTVNLLMATGSITGVTPTASEVYAISLYRQQPQPPVIVSQITCAPTAIAGGTTAEQAFTITPCPVQSMVWVNKSSSFTSGLGILGCRVSAAGAVAITFANTLVSQTITPPTELYTVAVIQPTPSAGSHIMQSVPLGDVASANQAQELRNAMVGIGMITGGTP